MKTDVESGFIRQRRNLILISLVLWFAQTSGLKIQKINVFGNELILERSTSVYMILWLGLLYFLIRYYQYLNDIDIGYTKRIYNKADEYALEKATKIYKSKHPDPEDILLDHQIGILRRDPWEIDISGEGYDFSKNNPYNEQHTELIHFGKTDSIKFKIRANIHILFKTRLFTEFIFPIIISYIPLMIYFF